MRISVVGEVHSHDDGLRDAENHFVVGCSICDEMCGDFLSVMPYLHTVPHKQIKRMDGQSHYPVSPDPPEFAARTSKVPNTKK